MVLPEEATAFAAIEALADEHVMVPAVQLRVGVVVLEVTFVAADAVHPLDWVATTV